MRKINFRVWHTEKKRMEHAPDLLWRAEGIMIFNWGIYSDGGNSESAYYKARTLIDGKKRFIMQATGLKDKNGKEIYEGDILNSLYKFEGCKGVYEVSWNENGACFYGKRHGVHQQMGVFVTPSDWTYCEIIGNIYQNPKLLK